MKTQPDGRKIGQPNRAKIFKIRTANTTARDALIQDLKKLPNVLFAEPNGTAEQIVIPNDQYFGNYDWGGTITSQWNLHNTGQYGTTDADIDAPEAWDIFTGSASRKIGIIDWGVYTSHPDLSGKVTGDEPFPYEGVHGVLVAGIAAAKSNNSIGVAGVDWNAQILSRNISGQDLPGIAAKIQSAVDAGADVLNNSWGLTAGYSTTVRLAFSYAYKLNRNAVAAMGNDGGNVLRYPAAYGQGIIAVGATIITDERAYYSNTGMHIDVSAPGGSTNVGGHIISTQGPSSYGVGDGTSMAAPHVSGVSSLLKGYNPNLSNDDIENIIRLSAEDVNSAQYPGWDQYLGTGRINARRALDRLQAPYTLTQSFVVGGTDQGASNDYYMTIYGAQALGLQDAVYRVQRHEVRRTISYPNTGDVAVWGRGTFTNGWNIEDEYGNNFSMGFCEPVPGTVTSTSATLRTYVYEVYDLNSQFLGWYPTPASNVRYEYSVHGRFSVSISGPTYVYHADPKGQPANCETWTANVTGGVTPYSYSWTGGYGTPSGSSYQECFSWNGYGGGSYQFTLRVDVTDASNPPQTTFATKTVTAYNSGGGGAIAAEGSDLQLIQIPQEFVLSQNFPNPFNPETQIAYGLPEPADVILTVSDLLGRGITMLVNGKVSPGYHLARWNGTDAGGNKVGSGIYFYRITGVGESGKQFTKVMKMLLAK